MLGDALEAGERFGGHAREDLHEEVVRESRGRHAHVGAGGRSALGDGDGGEVRGSATKEKEKLQLFRLRTEEE